MRLTQRKVNHVYFWDRIAWALAIRFIILQPVICVHLQWVRAPIFQSLFALSITVQLCVILMRSLSLSHPVSSHESPLCLHLFTRGSMEPIPQVFLSSGPPSSPAHRVWPKGSPLWDRQPLSVLAAPVLPKVWPQEIHSSSKSICNSNITETRVQRNAVFLEPSQSHSQLICLIMSGLPHACKHNKLNQKTASVGHGWDFFFPLCTILFTDL